MFSFLTIIYANTVFVAHSMLSAVFGVQIALRQLASLVFPGNLLKMSNGTRKGSTESPTKTPTQEHGKIKVEAVLPQSVRKADPDADLYKS